ncbi:WD40 repeat domain-containing protein [Mariniblastus fucicola]|uniref:WD domain, G-beta repeat n=1 Tax=Mariniblastus fucicola TaxID=980251 RepID=A0A5B9PDN9_9BACT|nr:WD40 repeat domain-containing protein [Mariniblastus fucicola]QEG22686.1 WD domain, G-beta repeat [Mariniblastus fucicola]
MIQRRHFLGAATAAAFCLTTRTGFCAAPVAALNWTSKVIQTVRHGNLNRKPVVTGVSLQPVGSLLAIVGDDHYVSLYDVQSQQFVEHLKKHTDWVRSAKFSADSAALFTCGNDHKLIRWETDQFTKPTFEVRQTDAIIELAISHDSTKVATVGFNENLIIRDSKTGDQISTLRCACNDNHAVAFSADDKLVAAGGRCGTIRVWDVDSQAVVYELKAHRRRIRTLEFTPEGELISAGDDQIVKVNRLDNPGLSVALPRQASKLFAVKTIAPSVIATSGSDNRIHIWNTARVSEIGVLENHTGTVSSLDMAQGVLVSGSFDTTVRIWTPNPDEIAVVTPRFVAPESIPSTAASLSGASDTFSTRR